MKRVTRKKGLRLIAGFKIAKGLLLLGASAGLLALLNRDLAVLLEQAVNVLHADPQNRIVHGLIAALGVMDAATLEELGVGTLAYGALTLTEGIGLWLAMRWAAWLTIAATSVFIPVELYTLSRRFMFVKVAVLAINVVIVWYLARQLRAERGENRQ